MLSKGIEAQIVYSLCHQDNYTVFMINIYPLEVFFCSCGEKVTHVMNKVAIIGF